MNLLWGRNLDWEWFTQESVLVSGQLMMPQNCKIRIILKIALFGFDLVSLTFEDANNLLLVLHCKIYFLRNSFWDPLHCLCKLFSCDPDGLNKFRRSRTQIGGTFPSIASTAKNCENPACRAPKWPPTGKPKLSRVTSGYGEDVIPWSRIHLTPKK